MRLRKDLRTLAEEFRKASCQALNLPVFVVFKQFET